jgi:hypothetical protein
LAFGRQLCCRPKAKSESDFVSVIMTGSKLSEETIGRYRSDGAVCIRGALGSEWISLIEKARRRR